MAGRNGGMVEGNAPADELLLYIACPQPTVATEAVGEIIEQDWLRLRSRGQCTNLDSQLAHARREVNNKYGGNYEARGIQIGSKRA